MEDEIPLPEPSSQQKDPLSRKEVLKIARGINQRIRAINPTLSKEEVNQRNDLSQEKQASRQRQIISLNKKYQKGKVTEKNYLHQLNSIMS